MPRIITHAIAHDENAHRAVVALLAIVAFAVLAYVSFIVHSVVSVVLSQEYAIETSHMGEEVSFMEARYLAESRTLTPEAARELGLVAVSKKHFMRDGGALSLVR